MTLTTHYTPAADATGGQVIGGGWRTVRAAHEQWFARTSWPRLALADEDRRWPEQFRHQSRGLLRRWKLEGLADRVDTVLTELVSNAVVHGGGPAIGFRLTLAEAGLLIEVADRSTELAHIVNADPDDENGRGLLLVEAFADAWGTRPRSDAGGKWTWAAFNAPVQMGAR
ncbi:ATP-binding protein [Streptomyces sp. NPDC006703]|uniref:ATP-binding protein n=1 Tax=Streptomyces sp. NPDC006703 TaxID=3364759 RepID=UPI003673B746